MADLRRRCPECKRQFRPRKGTRRLYCETCRPPRERALADVDPIGPDIPTAPGRIEARALAELTQAGRHETLEAEVVLHLARQLDQGKHTGSQTAALVARLLDARGAAMHGAAPPVLDVVDELAAQRERKAATA